MNTTSEGWISSVKLRRNGYASIIFRTGETMWDIDTRILHSANPLPKSFEENIRKGYSRVKLTFAPASDEKFTDAEFLFKGHRPIKHIYTDDDE